MEPTLNLASALAPALAPEARSPKTAGCDCGGQCATCRAATPPSRRPQSSGETDFEFEWEVRPRGPARPVARALAKGRATSPLSLGKRPLFSQPWPRRPAIGPVLLPQRQAIACNCRCPPGGTEMVRWVQTALNQVLGQRLPVSGVMDPATRAVLRQFQQQAQIPQDGIAGPQTVRQLEAQVAGGDPGESAAVTTTLAEPVASMESVQGELPTRAPLPAGDLWTHDAGAWPIRVAIFCPPAARQAAEVDVLLYGHGLLQGCQRPARIPEGMVTDAPFRLGQVVAQSGRPMVLVVPHLDWRHPGGEKVFGPGRHRWHALGKPAVLNRLIDEVMQQVGRRQSRVPPRLSRLIVAGHSRAYQLLEPLAFSRDDPAMQQGALARLAQIWALDSTYGGQVNHWLAWLQRKPGLQVHVFYRPGSATEAVAREFLRHRSAQLQVHATQAGHCNIPARALKQLLAPAPAAPGPAADKEMDWSGLFQPIQSVLPTPRPATPTNTTALRERIVAIARQEWEKWGRGTRREGEVAMRPRLAAYWGAVDESDFSPARAWSAAFISWVMRQAGAGEAFAYKQRHTDYITAAKRAAQQGDTTKFQAFPLDSVRPEPGDLICRDRAPKRGAPCAGTHFGNVDRGGISHSDIVTEVHPGFIVVLGGNTGQGYPSKGEGKNTVGQRKIPLDAQGRVMQSGGCRYFAIVKPPGASPATAPAPSSTLTGTTAPASPPTSRNLVPIRFAQRVLNRAAGERLEEDGLIGPRTRAALARFQRSNSLAVNSTLDEPTRIALVQRAFEQIEQQSMFGQIGVLDSLTMQKLMLFKIRHRLGFLGTIDDSTLAALTTALDSPR